MTKREVITHRIVGMKSPQVPCDIQSHCPAGASHALQADVTRYTRNVRVQRNHQLAWLYRGPDTAINSILRTNHPSQVEFQPLACASFRLIREKEPYAVPPPKLPRGIEMDMSKPTQSPAAMIQRRKNIGI